MIQECKWYFSSFQNSEYKSSCLSSKAEKTTVQLTHVWSFWSCLLWGTQTKQTVLMKQSERRRRTRHHRYVRLKCHSSTDRPLKFLLYVSLHTTHSGSQGSETYSHRPTWSCGAPQNLTFVCCACSDERVKCVWCLCFFSSHWNCSQTADSLHWESHQGLVFSSWPKITYSTAKKLWKNCVYIQYI